ncbi:MAG TPA: sigma-70 family RNA polymerase sigma factor [Candidatus Methylomirabilis sp.]|nr:sigma-70 family RNA polymerase sigma factor [Candidatus Methylomirabilis sp.]
MALLHVVVEEVDGPDVGTDALNAGQVKASERTVAAKNATRELFEQVFLANYGRVVSVLRRIVGDHGRAEDLANEVFLKLHQQALPTSGIDNVGGWLYRTATNLGIDELRASARRHRYEHAAARAEIKEAAAESALDQSLRRETQKRVRFVLAELKPVQAQLLLLRAWGNSYKELAEILELEPGTIGTRLIRAESAFEQKYVEMYGREEKP